MVNGEICFNAISAFEHDNAENNTSINISHSKEATENEKTMKLLLNIKWVVGIISNELQISS